MFPTALNKYRQKIGFRLRILNTALTHRTVSKSSTREGDGGAGEFTLDFKWREESEDIFRLDFFVVVNVVVVVVVFGPARGGLIFSPLIFFFGGGGEEGGVGNRTEFFGFRPNSIIPIITWNPEYPPHSWGQAIIIRLYTFTSFSLKTITANGGSLYPWSLPDAGSSSLGKDYCSKGSAAKHNFTLYIYACLAPYFGSLNWSQLQGTTFTVLHLSLLCIPNNQMFL